MKRKLLVVHAFLVICLIVITFSRYASSQEHKLIKDLTGANRVEIAKELMLRKNSGVFEVPELREVFDKIRIVVNEKISNSSSMAEDIPTLQAYLGDILKLYEINFEYEESLKVVFMYAFLFDHINYRLFFKYNIDEENVRNKKMCYEKTMCYFYLYGPENFCFYYYAESFTLNELYQYLKTVLYYDNSYRDERFPSLNIPLSEFFQMSTRESLFIPTFEPLDFEFFLKNMHLNIYPIGLIDNYYIYADGERMSVMDFFRHDVSHSFGVGEQNENDKYIAEIFIKTLYHQNLKEQEKNKLEILLFQLIHEGVPFSLNWTKVACLTIDKLRNAVNKHLRPKIKRKHFGLSSVLDLDSSYELTIESIIDTSETMKLCPEIKHDKLHYEQYHQEL